MQSSADAAAIAAKVGIAGAASSAGVACSSFAPIGKAFPVTDVRVSVATARAAAPGGFSGVATPDI